jgi:O-antigen ligase
MAARVGGLEWAGLVVVATASVILFGAVEERVLAPLETLLFAIAIIAIARRHRRGLPLVSIHPVAVPLVAILGVGTVQLLPLPTAVTTLISPGLDAVRDGIAPAAALPLSVYPYATMLAVLRLAAYLTFFVLTLEALSTPGRVRTALVWTAALGTAVATYGLFNHLAGNSRLLWMPRRFYLDSATGTFVNRNHFAALMVLLLPTLLACYWTGPRAHPRGVARGDAVARAAFFGLCGTIMCLAVLFSKSRGGILCGIVAFGGFWLVRARRGGRREAMRAALPLASIAVAGAWAIYIGTAEITARFAQLAGGLGSDGGRIAQWTDTAELIRNFPILGGGLGTYEFLYPMYKTVRIQADFAHAHNDYLELCAEAGVVGFAIGGWAIVRLGRYIMAAHRHRAATPLVLWPLLAGLSAMLLHSSIDFGLQVPGNVFCTLAVAAIAIRIAEDPSLAGAAQPAPAAPAALYPRAPSDSRTTS